MNEEIFKVIAESEEFQNGDKSWYSPIETEEDALEILLMSDYKVIDTDSRRWWNDVEVVAEFPTKNKTYYIGWWDAQTTGDRSPEDVGWEFDSDTISFYEKEEVITKTEKFTRIG